MENKNFEKFADDSAIWPILLMFMAVFQPNTEDLMRKIEEMESNKDEQQRK